ncbi:hypothetical protein chiPu_0019149 [Chiloscyllium punctatum]|uniref:Uncharacterized protein n=1 Tax=Chiloscyllium punctatum TaxID=137246 RepID=A0A401RQY6_CHIPU|nr:hypothetical protein [Chiloscyllium punctatum]
MRGGCGGEEPPRVGEWRPDRGVQRREAGRGIGRRSGACCLCTNRTQPATLNGVIHHGQPRHWRRASRDDISPRRGRMGRPAHLPAPNGRYYSDQFGAVVVSLPLGQKAWLQDLPAPEVSNG